MGKILVGFVFLICAFNVYSQTTLNYGYDGAGNQVYRGLNIYVSGARLMDNTKPDSIKNEVDSTYQVSVFPNPTTGILNINILGLPLDESLQYSVYDINGKSSLKGNVSNLSTIDLSKNSSGIYILALWMKGKKREWKIIKE